MASACAWFYREIFSATALPPCHVITLRFLLVFNA